MDGSAVGAAIPLSMMARDRSNNPIICVCLTSNAALQHERLQPGLHPLEQQSKESRAASLPGRSPSSEGLRIGIPSFSPAQLSQQA